MKGSNGSFREQIKRAFSSFAYEYSGEMYSRDRKMQVLSGISIDVPEQEKLPKVSKKTSIFQPD